MVYSKLSVYLRKILLVSLNWYQLTLQVDSDEFEIDYCLLPTDIVVLVFASRY